jgi:hypothetical protein
MVVGNAFDRYGSINPVVRWIMRQLERTLDELVGQAPACPIAFNASAVAAEGIPDLARRAYG